MTGMFLFGTARKCTCPHFLFFDIQISLRQNQQMNGPEKCPQIERAPRLSAATPKTDPLTFCPTVEM